MTEEEFHEYDLEYVQVRGLHHNIIDIYRLIKGYKESTYEVLGNKTISALKPISDKLRNRIVEVLVEEYERLLKELHKINRRPLNLNINWGKEK